ncbi:2Fe-2S iron-sulfur cluster-binding protein [Pseudooceanicola sp. MF1-13]|uniref:2Fe-2S iron-sulfur cluster-binding protein n=1 Tax=Pseudooceanicola sp. MF1-13 TaxID=3379095 RepID=UPI0038926741
MTQIRLTTRDGKSQTFEAKDDQSLMENIQVIAPGEVLALCGGGMSCATCHVFIDDGDLSRVGEMSEEEDMLLDDASSRKSNSRLSCQINVTPALDGLRVEIAPGN